jgi:hypothetical protein
MTEGVWIGTDANTDERLAASLDQVTARTGDSVPANGSAQGTHEVGKAMKQFAH